MSGEPPVRPSGEPPARSDGVRDRQVLLLAVAVVVAVLALRLLGELVPGVDQALSVGPLVIIALVAITAVVLLRALRPRHHDPR